MTEIFVYLLMAIIFIALTLVSWAVRRTRFRAAETVSFCWLVLKTTLVVCIVLGLLYLTI